MRSTMSTAEAMASAQSRTTLFLRCFSFFQSLRRFRQVRTASVPACTRISHAVPFTVRILPRTPFIDNPTPGPYNRSPVKRPELGRKAAEPEIDLSTVRVQLKPLFGVHPGTYLTVVYALILAAGLFFLLFYPGLRSRGTYVTFVSRPAGAAVVVDGSYRGATPVEVLVKAGTRKIEVSRPFMKTAAQERKVRGPVFGTLLLKPRERVAVDLELADLDGLLQERAQQFADYSHESAGSFWAETARILASPRIRGVPGIHERLQESLAAAMPFVVPLSGDLSDFLRAESLVATSGGVLTAGSLLALVNTLGSLASTRDYWAHWALLNLPSAAAKALAQAPWFVAETKRLASAELPGPSVPRVGAAVTVAGIALRPVPAGIAVIGDDTRPSARAQTVVLEPVHPVALRAFLMGETEVTNRQYAAFLAENPVWRKGNLPELMQRGLAEDRYLADWTGDSPPAGREGFPATGVSHYAARAFCVWLTGKLPSLLAGYTARLPSEAEWEWAARGGSRGTAYPGGSSPGDAPFRVSGQEGPLAAGSTGANGYGLRECMGNVWEWCEDWFAPGAYLMRSVDAARNASDTSSSIPSGSERVVRGGSWANEARQTAVYTRGSQPPSWTTPYTGFRVVVAPAAP
jgi:iron(II)-dependent oxidoreductase